MKRGPATRTGEDAAWPDPAPPGVHGGSETAPPAADAPNLGVGRATALGLIQGPTELLPVSSSAHLSLIPWLAGWRPESIDPETRKSFEVALHAGTAAALLIGQRRLIASELAAFDARRGAVVALSFVPPAVIGYRFERLGGPRRADLATRPRSTALRSGSPRPRRSPRACRATAPP